MSITRKSLADTYADNDVIIEAAQTAKREATLAYRGQLDGLGMDKDNIKAEIEGFKLAYRRKVAIEKKGEDVVEHRDAIADEIYLEITSPAPRATRVASDVPHDADGVVTDDEEIGSKAPASKAVEAVTTPKEITEPQAETPVQTGAAPRTPTSNAGTEAVAAPATDPVANVEEGANSAIAAASDDPASREADGADRQQPSTSGFTGEGEAAAVDLPTHSQPAEGTTLTSAATGDRRTEASPAATVVAYADPGIVVIEKCPPEGIVAHPFAACWPVNSINVTGGVREPIVKIGKLILDGRGRYYAARDEGIEYPVVQYRGTDPLLDCIRWNLASRKPSEQQRRLIAQKLAKLEPSRADDIMRAFDHHLEAAE